LIKRNPFLAAFLSLISPGIGQIYNGQLKKGFVYLFVPIFIIFVSAKLGLIISFPALCKTILLVYAFDLYVLIDGIIIAIKRKSIYKTLLNKWYIYLIIIILMPIAFLLIERNVMGLRPFIADGPSMSPTLITNDRFMISTNTNNLKRGNIIIFKWKK
jgi:signal peptidase I